MNERLKDTVKTGELSTTVREIVTELVQEVRVEMNKKIDDMKSDYDTKLIKYKTDVDALNLDNHRLRGIITKQERKIKEITKQNRESTKG